MLRSVKEFRENRFDSFSNNCFSTITFSVIVGFFGFRGYSRREYDEKERYGLSNLFEQNISLFFVVVTAK